MIKKLKVEKLKQRATLATEQRTNTLSFRDPCLPGNVIVLGIQPAKKHRKRRIAVLAVTDDAENTYTQVCEGRYYTLNASAQRVTVTILYAVDCGTAVEIKLEEWGLKPDSAQ